MNQRLSILLSTILIALGIVFFLVGSEEDITSSSVSPVPTVEQEEATESAIQGISSKGRPVYGWEGEQVMVVEVVDGDTIKTSSIGRPASGGDIQIIRFIGIDTPETKDPRKSVQCFGKEASNKAKELLMGKMVILQKDVSDTDIYKRLLRYIFLPLEDGSLLFVNDYLIREGYARALTYPPDVKYTEQFLEAQKQAKEGNLGLWGMCR